MGICNQDDVCIYRKHVLMQCLQIEGSNDANDFIIICHYLSMATMIYIYIYYALIDLELKSISSCKTGYYIYIINFLWYYATSVIETYCIRHRHVYFYKLKDLVRGCWYGIQFQEAFNDNGQQLFLGNQFSYRIFRKEQYVHLGPRQYFLDTCMYSRFIRDATTISFNTL